MKNIIFCCLLFFIGITVSFSQGRRRSEPVVETSQPLPEVQKTLNKWTLDKDHSNVLFTILHLGICEVNGLFASFDGAMENSNSDFSDAVINFKIDVNSINTNNTLRDSELKSAEFFNSSQYPELKFESTSLKPQKGNVYKLTGNLTVRDITKPVTFNATYGGMINALGAEKVAFKFTTTIDRFDFGLNWNKTLTEGVLIVGKDVTITINVELNKSL